MDKTSKPRPARRPPDPTTDGLPAAVEAEKTLLGLILLEASVHMARATGMRVSDFVLEAHQLIFASIIALYERGENIDRITVAAELDRRGELAKIGGITYLISLDEKMPRILNPDSYVKLIRDKSASRRLINVCDAMTKTALADKGSDPAALITKTHKLLDEIQTGGSDYSVLDLVPSIWKLEVNVGYLVDDILPEASVTMLTGESGHGKSSLVLAMVDAVSTGKPFLGRQTVCRPVLYIDRENPPSIVKERLFRMCIPETPNLTILGGWWPGHEPPGPDTRWLRTYAHSVRPLIVFDSLIAFAQCDENSNDEMRRHMGLYRDLAYLGATVLVIHHKSDKDGANYRGASDIKCMPDCCWIVTRDDGSSAADPLGDLLLTPFKARLMAKPIRVVYRDHVFAPRDAPSRPPLDILLDLIRLKPGSTQKELITLGGQQGLSKQPVIATLDAAVLNRLVELKPGRHNTYRYYILLPELGVIA
jgi:hypothetical protein